MMYSFENMKPAKKMLYEKLWGDKKFRSKDFITPKNWTGKESEDSFYIKSSKYNLILYQLKKILLSIVIL